MPRGRSFAGFFSVCVSKPNAPTSRTRLVHANRRPRGEDRRVRRVVSADRPTLSLVVPPQVVGRIPKNPLTFGEESRNCFGVRPDHTGMAQEGRKLGRFGDGTDEVIGALIEVHRHLGPGLMESAYEACLSAELSERRLKFERQRPLPIRYKGVHLDCAYRLDLVAFRSYPPGAQGGRAAAPDSRSAGHHLSAPFAVARRPARQLQACGR